MSILAAQCALGQARNDRDAARQGFGVSPIKIVLNGRPGTSAVDQVHIQTPLMERDSEFELTILDMTQIYVTGAKQQVQVGEGIRSCASWIDVPSTITVAARRGVSLPISVNFPPDAAGEYYAYVRIAHVPEPSSSQVYVQIKPAIDVQIIAVAPARNREQIDIVDLNYDAQSEHLVFDVDNVGEISTSIRGDVVLYGAAGIFPVRCEVPMSETGVPVTVLAGSKVSFRCPLVSSLPPDDYRTSVRLVVNNTRHLNGEFDLLVSSEGGATAGLLTSQRSQDLDLWVEPVLVEVETARGGTRSIPVRIQNRSEYEAKVDLAVSGVRVESNGFLTFFDEPARQNENSAWVSLRKKQVLVGAKRATTVVAQVTVPRDCPPGQSLIQALKLTGSAKKPGEDEPIGCERGVLIVAADRDTPPAELRVSAPVLVRSKPEANPSAAVVTIRNTGGKVARVKGRMVLEQVRGKQVAYVELGSVRPVLIVPGAERILRMDVPPVNAGEHRIKAIFSDVDKKSGMPLSTESSEVHFESTFSMSGS